VTPIKTIPTSILLGAITPVGSAKAEDTVKASEKLSLMIRIEATVKATIAEVWQAWNP
jgi:hypothetical protein